LAAAVGAAPNAAADPRDWLPYCSGDQTPIDSNCRESAHQVFLQDSPGANPEIPTGLTPDNQSVV
jgi:hypothetical protein